MPPRQTVSTSSVSTTVLACVSLAIVAQAQTVSAPTSDSPSKQEEIVTLSPFEVTAQTDNGYQATHTLAGTRFKSELRDVPASISVLTAEFLQDIGALNVNEAMEFTIGAETDKEGPTGNAVQENDLSLRLRGFRNSTLGRNFFQTPVSPDSYNIDRLTFSRGPNAVIFGTGGAGGIADTSTKRAKWKNETILTSRVGSYDDYRFELDVNRALSKKFAVRVNALQHSKHAWRDLESMERSAAAVAMTWRPFAKTTIRFDGEYYETEQLKPQPWPAFDAVTPWINAGRPISQTFGTAITATGAVNTNRNYFIQNNGSAYVLRRARTTSLQPAPAGVTANAITILPNENIMPYRGYLGGPSMTTNNDYLNLGLFLEQEIAKNLHLEVAANRQRYHYTWNRYLNFNDITLRADPNAQLPNGTANPFVGQYYIENNTRARRDLRDDQFDDLRASLAYHFDLGRAGKHQAAALASRRSAYDWDISEQEAWINNPAQRAYTHADNIISRRTYVSFDPANALALPATHLDPRERPVNVNGIQSGWYRALANDNLTRLDSAVAVLQSNFWNDRIVTTLGVRRDKLATWGSSTTLDAVTQEVVGVTRDAETSSDISGNTKTTGIVFHVLPWLSLSANASDNATPQPNDVVFQRDGDARNQNIGNRLGKGMDVSARANFLDNRIIGSLTYYETDEKNSVFAAGANWSNWLEDAYIVTGRAATGVDFSGDDAIDIQGQGWETEWVFNINENLKFIINGSRMSTVGANQFPRITALAREILPSVRALPAATPAPGSSANTATAGALADMIDAQLASLVRTEGLEVKNSREYSGNIYANYKFTHGALKGFGIGLGLNSRGPLIAGYDTRDNSPIYSGATNYVTAQLSYRRPLEIAHKKIDWSIQISGSNILGGRNDFYATSADENGVYRIFFEPVPMFSLTNRFSF